MPDGCRFANRCPLATNACSIQPPLETLSEAHTAACWHHEKT
jgi:oligopeptide/dipeptide ABC transporter ATP-binding protein